MSRPTRTFKVDFVIQLGLAIAEEDETVAESRASAIVGAVLTEGLMNYHPKININVVGKGNLDSQNVETSTKTKHAVSRG